MPTADDFRRVALGMNGAIESAHMGHPDFRANGRIFATIHPGGESAMVKLTPDQQRAFVRDHPKAFTPENGAWGRQGCTAVNLAPVDQDALGEAIALAWQNAVVTGAARRTTAARPRSRTRGPSRALRRQD